MYIIITIFELHQIFYFISLIVTYFDCTNNNGTDQSVLSPRLLWFDKEIYYNVLYT